MNLWGWREQHCYLSTIRGLHEQMRLVIGKVEHLARNPDWVFGVEVVFDAHGIDARGYVLIRHLDAQDECCAAKSTPDAS